MHTIHFKGLERVRQFQMKKELLIVLTDCNCIAAKVFGHMTKDHTLVDFSV